MCARLTQALTRGVHFFTPRLRRCSAPSAHERGQGSGFVVDGARGHVLTNAHVVAGARAVRVTFTDGRTFDAAVLGADEVTDIALLSISACGGAAQAPLPAAPPLGDSGALDVGDWVVAVGNPFGLDSSVTLGIVSALRRSAAEVGIPDKRLAFIQTDAAINPGNSGGPLVNEFGEVVGLSTAIRADAEGIGFAIPINTARAVADALAAGRPVHHPYLGIQVRACEWQMAAALEAHDAKRELIPLPCAYTPPCSSDGDAAAVGGACIQRRRQRHRHQCVCCGGRRRGRARGAGGARQPRRRGGAPAW